jgi:transcription elongation factor
VHQCNDKKLEPGWIDERAHVRLVVPSMEKVGQLGQSSTPLACRSYWMAFSNKGRLVKPGDHVNVVIGDFRANGLVVE